MEVVCFEEAAMPSGLETHGPLTEVSHIKGWTREAKVFEFYFPDLSPARRSILASVGLWHSHELDEVLG